MDPTSDLEPRIVPTEDFSEQQLSNIFLRRHTDVFCAPHFVEHVTQALLYSVDIQSATVILSSDGRYRSAEAMERAARVLAGNSVRRVLVESRSLPSAIACLLRDRHSHFAFIFTGGHHPAKEYLGVKVLTPPGIPMRKEVLEKANKIARILKSYQTCEDLRINFDEKGTKEYFVSRKHFTVETVSSAPLYCEILSRMFDFALLKEYIKENSITITVDCSYGVTGPIVLDILRNRLEVREKNILNKDSLEDFGDLPADPNPASRVDFLELNSENKSDVGIVISPDGSRCLIMGEDGFVVSPSDTLAIITDQCKCIPFFRENPLKGIVCSICTSQAPDVVSRYSSLLCFIVQPGWEHFAPAMLPGLNHSILFGEEGSAVGASSCNYCGDKDAVWTSLAWLSILANRKQSVKEVMMEHWKKFGRNVLGRMDFENLPSAPLDSFMSFFKDTYTIRLKKIKSEDSKNSACPLDLDYDLGIGATQIYQIQMAKEARVIIRRSESVCNSTTLRFYIEVCLEPDDDRLLADRKEILQPYIRTALKISKIHEFLGENITPVIV